MHLPVKILPLVWFILQRPPFFTRKNGRIGTASDSLGTIRIGDLHLNDKELLAIRRIFSLVDMISNTKFSNCPYVFKIGVVWQ